MKTVEAVSRKTKSMSAIYSEARGQRVRKILENRARLKLLHSRIRPLAKEWYKAVRKAAADFQKALRRVPHYAHWNSATDGLDRSSLNCSLSNAGGFNLETPSHIAMGLETTYPSFRISNINSERKIKAKAVLVWCGPNNDSEYFLLHPSNLSRLSKSEVGRKYPLSDGDISLLLDHEEMIANTQDWKGAQEKLVDAMKQCLQNLAKH